MQMRQMFRMPERPRQAVQPSEQASPDEAPQLSAATLNEGMALKLKRSQSKTVMGKPQFILDARLEVSAEIRQHIDKYKLGTLVIYESAARQKHREAIAEHLEGSRDNTSLFAPGGEQMKGVGKTMWHLARAAGKGIRTSLALKITINSLISGHHIKGESMDEILEAEEAITEAARNLKAHLQVAGTFSGQEEVIEI
jgi:hypothetical protein